MKTESNWLVCQAHTKAECWSTLALMLQVTPELEDIWERGRLAFDVASMTADVRELQVRCPMRVVEVNEEISASKSFQTRIIFPIITDTAWHLISAEHAAFMLQEFKEVNLEFGYSHLEFRPPVDTLYRVRACTAAKHVDDDIFGLEDVHPKLLEAFTHRPALV